MCEEPYVRLLLLSFNSRHHPARWVLVSVFYRLGIGRLVEVKHGFLYGSFDILLSVVSLQ